VTYSVLSISGILLSTTCLALAVIVIAYGRRDVHRKWAIFNICVSIWGLGMFFLGRKGITPAEAQFWWKFAHTGGIYIPVVFLHTTLDICEIRGRKIMWLFYLQASFFAGLVLSGHTGWTLEYMFDSFYYVRYENIIYLLITLFWFMPMTGGFVLLYIHFLKSRGQKRNQYKYFLGSMLIGFAGGASHFFPVYGIYIYPFNITIVLYVLIATYAILRHRLMDINLVFRKSMVYSLSAGIMTSFFVIFVIAVTRILPGVTDKGSFIITSLCCACKRNSISSAERKDSEDD